MCLQLMEYTILIICKGLQMRIIHKYIPVVESAIVESSTVEGAKVEGSTVVGAMVEGSTVVGRHGWIYSTRICICGQKLIVRCAILQFCLCNVT